MRKTRLHLYTLDMKYVRDLSKADDKVMSVSPQENKENRPFVGIVVIMDGKKYCIPLTSPKPKHEKMKNDLDFSKMYDAHNRLIGALNFNNMIPVSEEFIKQININPSKNDSPKDKIYKELLNNQLDWCNDNFDNITKKANKLYKFVTQTPEKSRNLTRRCCDFKKLEAVLEKRLAKSAEKSKSTVQTEEKKPSVLGRIKELQAEQAAKEVSSQTKEKSNSHKKEESL